TGSPIFEIVLVAHPKSCAADGRGSAPFALHRPVEEGQFGSRRRRTVGIEKVIGAGIVLIDGLLDQAQAEQLGVEALVSRDVSGDRSQMMNARQLHLKSSRI